MSLYVADQTLDLVPNGSKVTKIRQVVVTSACNQCHDPLNAHGETGRRDVAICVLCHTPQSTDAESGNTVDLKVMIHKIHMGAELPSVRAGKPCIIVGFQSSANDFSWAATTRLRRLHTSSSTLRPSARLARPVTRKMTSSRSAESTHGEARRGTIGS